MSKKRLAVLASIFIVFLIAGIYFNTMSGLHMNDVFWKKSSDSYRSDGVSIRYYEENGQGYFDLSYNKQTRTAEMTRSENLVHISFPEGCSIECRTDGDIQAIFSRSGVRFGIPSDLIIDDIDQLDLPFVNAKIEAQPFSDSSNGQGGETYFLVSESGDRNYLYDRNFDQPDFSVPPVRTIVLKNGLRISESDLTGPTQLLVQNEAGQYLMDTGALFGIQVGPHRIPISDMMDLMMKIEAGESTQRGMIVVVLIYILLYIMGAACMLGPEKFVFFGSRWRYANEPKLSQEGLTAAYIGAGFCMFCAIVILFIPIV